MESTQGVIKTNGEAYLSALYDRGVEYIFANGGTDFAPIIESYVQGQIAGRQLPRIITVPHENVAVGMATGYFKLSGRIAAVMVHVNVGTANALLGIMNASRDNVPIFLAAGRTPATEFGHPGSRNVPIHWGQEAFDQGGVVREYVKWDYELRSGQPVDTVVERALDIAMSEPFGPVYLTLPREVLWEPASDPVDARRQRPLGSIPPSPSLDAIEIVADILGGAEMPLIVAGEGRRTRRKFEALSELAESFAIPVIHGRQPTLPHSHPMNLGSADQELFNMADVIVAIDAPVPYMPRFVKPNAGIKIIHIAYDPMYSWLPYRGFPMDISLAGSSELALVNLIDALKPKMKHKSHNVDSRRTIVHGLRQSVLNRRNSALEKARASKPIHPIWVAHCINQVKATDTIVVNELGVPSDFLEFADPGCCQAGDASGGLGGALGLSLGAKLAAPERDVITVVGDGTYMFGNPTAAHYVGRAENLPTLTVICNNSMWHEVKSATMTVYPDGAASRANALPMVDLSPSPSFEKIIESVEGYGELVEDPDQLTAAIERGIKAVSDGKCSLLNVKTMPG